jgi:heme/copper-type cytochrome/quinol oxidase subunit 2
VIIVVINMLIVLYVIGYLLCARWLYTAIYTQAHYNPHGSLGYALTVATVWPIVIVIGVFIRVVGTSLKKFVMGGVVRQQDKEKEKMSNDY